MLPYRGFYLMSLEKLARELEETARQTASMAEGVTEALDVLADPSLSGEEARRLAANVIVRALQGQDRISQRCHNMAYAVRQFEKLPPGASQDVYDEIWSSLVLDELRVPGLAGTAYHDQHGDAELF